MAVAFREALKRLAASIAGGTPILAKKTTGLVEKIKLPESPGVRTFVKRFGGTVSKNGNVDRLEYLRAVAKAADVPPSQIATITDEISAWEVISKNLGLWGGGTIDADAMTNSARYAKTLNINDIASKNSEPFNELVKAIRGDGYNIEAVAQARASGDFSKLPKDVRTAIERASKLVEEAHNLAAASRIAGDNAGPILGIPEGSLKEAGFRGVRYARNADDIVDLIKAGEVSKAKMAFDDMNFNSMLSVPPSLRNKYLTKHDSPLFYLLSDVRNRWISANTGIPLNAVQVMGGIGSAMASPKKETLRVIRAATGLNYSPTKGFFPDANANFANSGRSPIEPASLANMASALNDLVNNKVGGMSLPSRSAKVRGLGQKTKDYSTQSGSALGTKSSVQDQWEHRAPFASTSLPTPDSGNVDANLVLQAVSASAARQLGVSNLPAAQEMRWANMHELVEGKLPPAFFSVDDPRMVYPQLRNSKTDTQKAITDYQNKANPSDIQKDSLPYLQAELNDDFYMDAITRRRDPASPPSTTITDIFSNISDPSNPVPLRLQQGLVDAIENNPADWRLLAGTPVPNPTNSFVVAPSDPGYSRVNNFAEWLANYADESRAMSRSEKINTLMSQLPKRERSLSFKTASPYMGAAIPPALLTLMALKDRDSTNDPQYDAISRMRGM